MMLLLNVARDLIVQEPIKSIHQVVFYLRKPQARAEGSAFMLESIFGSHYPARRANHLYHQASQLLNCPQTHHEHFRLEKEKEPRVHLKGQREMWRDVNDYLWKGSALWNQTNLFCVQKGTTNMCFQNSGSGWLLEPQGHPNILKTVLLNRGETAWPAVPVSRFVLHAAVWRGNNSAPRPRLCFPNAGRGGSGSPHEGWGARPVRLVPESFLNAIKSGLSQRALTTRLTTPTRWDLFFCAWQSRSEFHSHLLTHC